MQFDEFYRKFTDATKGQPEMPIEETQIYRQAVANIYRELHKRECLDLTDAEIAAYAMAFLEGIHLAQLEVLTAWVRG